MRAALAIALAACAAAPPPRLPQLGVASDIAPARPAPAAPATDITDTAIPALIAGDYVRVAATFDPTGAPTAAQIAEVWRSKTAGLGAVTGWRIADRTFQDGFATRIVLVALEHGELEVLLSLATDAQQIASMFVTRPAPPAAYVDPGRFHELAVTIGAPPLALPATLTVPSGAGPFPAVVLVHGSGPNDRDETVGANKIFKDLAEGLATAGIAVLRYEKRTYTYGDQLTNTITLDDEVVTDAIAAVHLLAARADIGRVVVIGHSLGGMLAPEIALRAGGVAGVALLSPPARPPWEIVRDQMRYLRAPRETRADLERTITLMAIGGAEGTQFMGMPYSYWQDWARRDGIVTARQLARPVLVLHGDRDYQVTGEDFALWQRGLAGVPGAELVTYSGDNHLFVVGHGTPGPLEYKVPAHVDPRVVARLIAFVSAAGSPSRGSARSSAGAASTVAARPAGDLRR